jgi:hypothetical protein
MRPDNRHRRLRQHVLVLGSGSPPGQPRCRSASVDVRHTDHDDVELRYRVHLLRNASAEALLAHPVTAVFAPLARCPPGQRIDLVRRAAAAIGAARSAGLDQRDVIRILGMLEALLGPDERIDADLADRLGALPDAERRIRQAASLDQLLS